MLHNRNQPCYFLSIYKGLNGIDAYFEPSSSPTFFAVLYRMSAMEGNELK